jgi:hypothetical protein
MDCFVALLLAMTADSARPAMTAWKLPVRIRPLELAQQTQAALDGLVERGLRLLASRICSSSSSTTVRICRQNNQLKILGNFS